jgi:hypothetical protein
VPSAEDVIAAWEAWDKAPGDHQRAKSLARARVAYVGLDHANAFQAWIAEQRRAGRTVAAAVYSWRQP